MSRRRPAHRISPTPGMIRFRRMTAMAIALPIVVGGIYVFQQRDDAKPTARTLASSSVALPPDGASASGAPSTSAAPAPPSTADPAQTFTISAVGDTMLGKNGNGPPNPSSYFSSVQSALKDDAQIVFGNLEGTLSDVSGSKCGEGSSNCFAFQVPPSYAQYLASAGFTILNTANNHSHDFGEAGLRQTVDAVHGAGMVDVGQRGQVTVVDAGSIRVAFVGFAPYRETANMLDLGAARALIQQASKQSDVVVVYMHAGAEGSDAQHVTGKEESYVGEDRGNAQEFAHMAIDQGAALVLGSGPHVLRGMEFYKGHLIVYSLGNFAGYSNFNTSGILSNSAIVHVTLNGAGAFVGGQLVPVALTSKNQPTLGGDAVSMVARLSRDDFGAGAPTFGDDGTITAPG